MSGFKTVKYSPYPDPIATNCTNSTQCLYCPSDYFPIYEHDIFNNGTLNSCGKKYSPNSYCPPDYTYNTSLSMRL